jgi:ABC-type multidrug transport system fused ATPase/permease subunit
MLFEMGGLGLLFPILTFFVNPDSLTKYTFFSKFFNVFNTPSESMLTIILLTFLTSFYLLKTLFLLYLNWERNSFSINISKTLSQKLFKGYLNQDYSFHLQNNSSTLLKNIQGEVQLFTSFITAIINVTVEGSFAFGIIMILILTEPKGALIVMFFLGISAYIFSTFTKKKLKKWSFERQIHSTIINRSLIEGLSGIKDLIIYNRIGYFYNRYSKENEKLSKIITKVNFLGTVPRLYLEMLSILGISILIIIANSTKNGVTLVPILGIFAAAAFRIIPSLNSMMSSIQQVRFSISTIDLLSDDFSKLKKTEKSNNREIKFNKSISISNLYFKFEPNGRNILNNISLEIEKGQTVGFIGISGSGKSTLVDILIGLYKLENGSILIDDVNLKFNEIAWRDKIGYVPQTIFLIDDSLKRNIAFGIPDNEIDEKQIYKVIESANLTDFVSQLPDKINSHVGERGVRISGGQRQRIGIARALYINPEILILDEATSALDNNTEVEIMQTIQQFKGNKTIIIVAHRLTTLENCDKIFVLENGTIKESGDAKTILTKYK